MVRFCYNGPMKKTDIVIVGAGVIGLSCAERLSQEDRSVVVVEKNRSFGEETSSRNSEVIHAGLYYRPGSLKAITCIEGREILYDFCEKHTIPHRKTGKLIVATDSDEESRVERIFQNARICGVTGLRYLARKEIRAYAPDVKVRAALFCEHSGIIDSHQLMNVLYQAAQKNGVLFSFSTEVVTIEKTPAGYTVTVREPQGNEFSFGAEHVINCAGLHSDTIASRAGIDIDTDRYRLHYCKGQYFRLNNPRKYSLERLIYPPATKVSLGIHLTPDLAGGLRLGPDAHYRETIDYTVDMGQKRAFYDQVKRFLPALKEEELIPDTAGIRPKLQAEDEDFRDFLIREESDNGLPGVINLIGIESPGLTACLTIAGEVTRLLT